MVRLTWRLIDGGEELQSEGHQGGASVHEAA